MVRFVTSALLGLALKSTSTFADIASRDRGGSNGHNPWLIQNGNTCRVVAKGAGQDDGPTIVEAFSRCGKNAKVQLEEYYVVNTILKTIGLQNVEIVLTGTIQYTPNIAYWSANSFFLTYQNATTFWLLGGDHLHLHGGGTIDGNGQVWWDALASSGNAGTAGGSSTTFARPIPLTVYNSTDVLIEDIHQIGSPFWNNFVIGSSFVEYRNIIIVSKSFSSSPAANSDGWDIYRSDHITIRDSNINNDDDCVSFKPNSTNIFVSNLSCNGSHGVSVGSLGQYAGETDIVANVTVENVVMANAQNGARIKVFGGNPSPASTAGGGTGFVRNVTYRNYLVENVDNPILIDQCYSTPAATCAQFPSALNISDVHFIDITGTSSGNKKGVVVSMKCSTECKDITATGTDLTPPAPFNASYICQNIATLNELDFPCGSGNLFSARTMSF